MNRPHPPTITVKPFDLTRRLAVYDGSPEDWYAPVSVPMGLPHWTFTLAEIDGQSFARLEIILGTGNFNRMLETQGYVRPQTEFEDYWGECRLPLRYYTRESKEAGICELILVSFGEFQPMRWIANIEGIWQVTGADF